MTQHFGEDPEAIPGAKIIRKGFIRAFTSGTHTGDVQLVGSHPTLLTGIRFAPDIPAAECDVGRECLVIFLDPINPTDASVLSVQGAVPGAPGGGDTTFIAHTDTPASYSGQGGKFVRVNATPDGLEFYDHEGAADPHAIYLTETEADALYEALGAIATHAAIAAAHHAKYLDSEAVAAAKTVKLDDFATPDDNADLNASITRHGLLKKLANDASKFLDSKGDWSTPPGGGGDDHAPLGALYPSVLSTGLKPPQVPYYGDGFTATKFYCRVSVVPAGAAITVQLKRGVGEGASANLGTAASIAIGDHISTAGVLNQAIASGDFFEINITQVGTSPNEGSDLVWLVAP